MTNPYCKKSDEGKASSTQLQVAIQSVFVTSFMKMFILPTQNLSSKYKAKFLFVFSWCSRPSGVLSVQPFLAVTVSWLYQM